MIHFFKKLAPQIAAPGLLGLVPLVINQVNSNSHWITGYVTSDKSMGHLANNHWSSDLWCTYISKRQSRKSLICMFSHYQSTSHHLTMTNNAMKSLLTPVISNYFSMYKKPQTSSILQVLRESHILNPGIDGNGPFMQLELSDGDFFFCCFVAQGDLPGRHSLVRICPSESNKILTLWADKKNEFKDFIYLHDYVKILDGKFTKGTIGNPVEIRNAA